MAQAVDFMESRKERELLNKRKLLHFKLSLVVFTPAKAGVQLSLRQPSGIPAFAGMTVLGGTECQN
jgi:hypothetical protein